MIALEIVLALAAGIMAGLTGGGGGVIFVPLLMMIGLTPTQAVATANLSICITAVSATAANARRGLLPWRRVGLIAVGALVLGPVGAWLGLNIPSAALLIGLIALNFINIVLIGRRAKRSFPSSDIRDESGIGSGSTAKVVATGGAGGLMAGVFGVGGGIIMVPLQVAWLHTPIRAAARISLAVIVVATGSSVVGYALQGGGVDWLAGAVVGIGGLAGAPIGAAILRRLSNLAATRLMQTVLALVSVSLIIRFINAL